MLKLKLAQPLAHAVLMLCSCMIMLSCDGNDVPYMLAGARGDQKLDIHYMGLKIPTT